MRIVATSDWHGHLPETLPEGDVLVIAGDILSLWDHTRIGQTRFLLDDFLPYLAELPHEHIVFIAGNHDFGLEGVDAEWMAPAGVGNIHYLKDSGVTIHGVKFWGAPWSVYLPRWSHMLREDDLALHWNLIPEDTHVLVVHGPPYGACDFTSPRYGSKNVGSKTLRDRITELRVPLVITGHIHEGYGSDRLGASQIENVSLMNIDYEPVNPPRVLMSKGG